MAGGWVKSNTGFPSNQGYPTVPEQLSRYFTLEMGLKFIMHFPNSVSVTTTSGSCCQSCHVAQQMFLVRLTIVLSGPSQTMTSCRSSTGLAVVMRQENSSMQERPSGQGSHNRDRHDPATRTSLLFGWAAIHAIAIETQYAHAGKGTGLRIFSVRY